MIVVGAILLWQYDRSESVLEKHSSYRLNQDEISLLTEGDIIMRKGYGLVSRMIVQNLKEGRALSHCGIVVKKDEDWNIIHTVSSSLSDVDGMQIQTLQDFVHQSKPGSIVVSRLRECEDRSKIAKSAYRYLGKAVTFDNSFDLLDSSKIYCTELIWRVFNESAQVDIYNGNYEGLGYYSFENLLNPEKFDIVIDHHK